MFWLSLALLVGLFYLLVSAWGFGFSGFPLDDAWIHQTYARNLARSGQLAFTPGQPSAGSTAPLWSLLLSLGYLLGLPFQFWTYGLGLLGLGLTGWTMARLAQRLFPRQGRLELWVGLFCLFEWHLVWAAVSGMETILFVWLSVLLVERYLAYPASHRGETPPAPHRGEGSRRLPPVGRWGSDHIDDLSLGLVGGLLVLTRPEGLGLVGLVGLDMAYRGWRAGAGFGRDLLVRWTWLGLGLGLLLAPYVIFHLRATGLPFPNTFYAKQAEYGVILQTFPLWQRLFGSFGQPPVETVQGVFRVIFIGAQVLLLPGLGFAAWLTIKERRAELVLVWLWWTGYLLVYGLRLPVTYQHGRYEIPAIPWVLLLGLWGSVRLGRSLSRRHVALGLIGRSLTTATVVLLLAFAGVGARAYSRDVRIIETEMVAAARWLDANIPADALVAAHDIGAIGYFAGRPLIDLAGLVTPEVIPIIRDEAALLDYIVANRAGYLVTFPSWYPDMVRDPRLERLYTTAVPYAPAAGGDNMAVYQIK